MTRREPISEEFAVERDRLVRRVVPRRGRAYEHRCSLEVTTDGKVLTIGRAGGSSREARFARSLAGVNAKHGKALRRLAK